MMLVLVAYSCFSLFSLANNVHYNNFIIFFVVDWVCDWKKRNKNPRDKVKKKHVHKYVHVISLSLSLSLILRVNSGAMIKIASNEGDGSDRLVTITGTPESVGIAQYLINSRQVH